MSEARVLPLLGALLGALLGLVTMAVLTVTGVIAADRLPLFAIVGLGVILGTAMLTQRITLAKKRVIGAVVVGALLVGVSLTGIPELARGGSTSENCMASGTSSLEPSPVTAANTTATDGFSVTPTDTIEWTTQTSMPIPAATAAVSMYVGGIGIPLQTFTFAEGPFVTSWQGTQSVESQLAQIEDASGFLVTGIYHVAVQVDADAGQCASNAYIRVAPAGPFDTPLLKLLWSAGGVLLLALLVLAVVVRRSIRESDRSLAMVGMSAIPGETFTTPPVSPRTRASAPRLSEPSQPTVPETEGDKVRQEQQRTSKGQRGSSAGEAGAATSDSFAHHSPAGGGATKGEVTPEGEVAPEGEAIAQGDERIGTKDVTNPAADEGDTDRPARDT